MNLRELTHDQEAILAQVESGDFTLEDVADHLDMLEEDRNQKIENYLHVINRLSSEEKTITAEIDRLQEIRASKEKALVNIKGWLVMSLKDGEKHEFDLFSVSRVKGRDVVEVLDSNKIPMKYKAHKPESWSDDKRKILADLEAGKDIPGAQVSQGKPSLRIK
jgi:DNA repair exonuclease SbcCD ATPase subunit